MEKTQDITQNSLGIRTVLSTMCNFVTVDIIKAAGFKMKYSDTELDQLHKGLEELRETYFFDEVFSCDSRIHYEKFQKLVE